MARSEARLSADAWDDEDFAEGLSRSAQGTYCFLLSQRDLHHTGVIGLWDRRWARKGKGLTLAALWADLEELRAGGFVVIDEENMQILVRSLIRRDKVYRQPNVLRAAKDQIQFIQSPTIRTALLVELNRIVETG